MVTSVHLASPGPRAALKVLRRPPKSGQVPGLNYAEACTLTPLSPSLLPGPKPGRVGLIAHWADDAALDAFLTEHPVADALKDGYRARMEPVRVVGAWPELVDLPSTEQPAGDGPVAVLTLGRLRIPRAGAFLRASAKAEADALAHPALELATAMARPPHLVATFSIWREIPPMRDYVQRSDGGHRQATTAHATHPFHSASAFIRYRILEQAGEWEAPTRPSQWPGAPVTEGASGGS